MQVSDLYVLDLYDFYLYIACLIFVLYGFIFRHIISCKIQVLQ